MVAAILHANNIRDMAADRAVNKRTLAVIFGIRFARLEYMFLVIGTYITQLIVIAAGVLPVTTILTFITLPEAMRLIRIFNTSRAVPLNASSARPYRQIARSNRTVPGARLGILSHVPRIKRTLLASRWQFWRLIKWFRLASKCRISLSRT